MAHDPRSKEIWFVTGSQHLYGPETLEKVAEHSRQIAEALSGDSAVGFTIVFKPVLTGPDGIRRLCLDANSDDKCIGLITWMHTFSPAKMWIAGLSLLTKPLLHLHTQFNRDIPWAGIDMDFMNLNQSAHGDREFGFIGARLGIGRKIVVGHWEAPDVRADIGSWARVALGNAISRSLKIARFGDNMRQVAVTEGDKVEAQSVFGWETSGFGVGDLVARINEFSDSDVDRLMADYEDRYDFAAAAKLPGGARDAVRVQARIELGLSAFLSEGGYGAFTTTFEDLHGLEQLPGLAAQHLMEAGYGFAGEGDWKTAGLVHVMKTIAGNKGTSFMEDYTYHFDPANELVLGSHMLEICPTIAASRPRVEVHPLSIGGKADPARLVFDGGTGPAICASVVDMGNRFRLIVNNVDAVATPHAMPNLPVARVLWKPQPSLRIAAESWIRAGGAHHTGFSFHVTTDQMTAWAEMTGIECAVIDHATTPRAFENELRWSDIAWKLR